jgi:hypothetical protein
LEEKTLIDYKWNKEGHLEIVLDPGCDRDLMIGRIIGAAAEWSFFPRGPINGKSRISLRPKAPLVLEAHSSFLVQKGSAYGKDPRMISILPSNGSIPPATIEIINGIAEKVFGGSPECGTMSPITG